MLGEPALSSIASVPGRRTASDPGREGADLKGAPMRKNEIAARWAAEPGCRNREREIRGTLLAQRVASALRQHTGCIQLRYRGNLFGFGNCHGHHAPGCSDSQQLQGADPQSGAPDGASRFRRLRAMGAPLPREPASRTRRTRHSAGPTRSAIRSRNPPAAYRPGGPSRAAAAVTILRIARCGSRRLTQALNPVVNCVY